LVAGPIGLQVIRPTQENQAFRILKRKFYGKYGLKYFPGAKKAALAYKTNTATGI
jgi:hypothetical protein